MKKNLLLASVAALGLAAATGAQSADIPILVTPVYTPIVVAVPAGPVYRLEADATVYFVSGPGGGFRLDTMAIYDRQTASGFGFQVGVSQIIGFDPFGGEGFLLGRVYHTIGTNATIGAFAGTFYGFGGGGFGVGDLTFGVDADYHTDTLDAFLVVGRGVGLGGDGVSAIGGASFERGRLSVDTVAVAGLSGGFGVFGAGVFGYSIGPVTPFIGIAGGASGMGGGFGAAIGADFEQEVGRLTLTGTVSVPVFNSTSGFGFGPIQAAAGFELPLGNGPLTLHGDVGFSQITGVTVGVGIGLELGPGRITGVGGIDLEEMLVGLIL